MKFLLLSLLPLAVDLAAARPARQAESAALTRRNSPNPPAESPERSESEKPTPNASTSLFSEPDGYDYSTPLDVNIPSDAAAQFLGLGDDEVAELESMFTDDKAVNVATRPGLKLPEDAYDFSTAFLDDGNLNVALFGTDGSVVDDDTKQVDGKKTEKTDVKTYRPDFPIPDAATFDPKVADFFDEKGLPTKVVFSPTDDYKAKIDLPAPATTPTPQTDYSLFLDNSPILQRR